MKLAHLYEIYTSALEETNQPNPDYRAEKLKRKLEKSHIYGHKLPFCSLNSGGKFRSYNVYNSDMSTDRSVTHAYELGSTDMVQDVAEAV